MKPTIEGIPELIAVLDELATVWDNPDIVEAGAMELVEAQRRNVRQKLSRNSRGVLENKLQVVHVKDRVAEAGIPANALRYALAHEFGVTIYPKKAKVLRFVIDGKEIFAKKVKIPARPYVRPSVNQAKFKAALAILRITRKKIMEMIK